MKETLITPAGFARLVEEIDRLKTTGRQEVAERIRHAFSIAADPTANAEYQAVLDEQARLETRIARLEERLSTARVAEPDGGNDVVDLGERVRVRDLDTGARREYEVVGSFEVDPTLGRVSAESPLGRALMGRRSGEVALVEAPKGRIRLEIVGIEAPVVAA